MLLRFCFPVSIDILEELIMLVFIGIIAFIGAVVLLVSSALSIISLGIAIIIKVAAAIIGIGCGILLLLFAIFLIEEMMNS